MDTSANKDKVVITIPLNWIATLRVNVLEFDTAYQISMNVEDDKVSNYGLNIPW